MKKFIIYNVLFVDIEGLDFTTSCSEGILKKRKFLLGSQNLGDFVKDPCHHNG
jgi:hypothetical protein